MGIPGGGSVIVTDKRTKADTMATCFDCSWVSYAKNSWGNGARHARAHDHTVHVQVVRIYIYGGRRS